MATIDYGVILKKNGKIINRDILFMDMKKSLGFEIEQAICQSDKSYVKGIADNHFAYAGNSELVLCFYKFYITIVFKNDKGKYLFNIIAPYKYWEHDEEGMIIVSQIGLTIGRLDSNIESRALAKWQCEDNYYECIFGYGVDSDEEVWNDIKYYDYGFTDKEIEIIDKFFEEE